MVLGVSQVGTVLALLGALMVAVAVGGGVLIRYRRRLFDEPSDLHAGVLDSLRDMRRSGKITEEEFDAARKRMAARLAGVQPPPSAARAAPQPGEMVARPGYDLTGAPLPGADKRDGTAQGGTSADGRGKSGRSTDDLPDS